MITHKFNNPDELYNLFEMWVEEQTSNKEYFDEERMMFFEETLLNMADGDSIYLDSHSATVVGAFLACFYFDDNNGGYSFEYDGITAQGETEVIKK